MLLTARARALLAFASVITPALALLTAAAVPAATPAAAATGQIAHRHVCAAPSAHHVACLAIIDTNAAGHPLTRAAATAAGLHPYMAADLQAAYRLPSGLLGSRQTIAIVDAYDDPNAESDLAAYRAANHLPPCTTANGCFKKVNQQGQQGSYPPADPNWAVEISLDLDMASAICPNCKIVLVEANSNNDSDMFAAENQAARLGANVISDSWGEPEFAVTNGPAATCARHFSFPKVAITAGTGDSGLGVSFPSTCASVTGVGGTTLYPDSNARGWTETAWPGGGSGCSAYITKPAWQHDPLCGKRTVADVSAVADPDTPVAVYDTYGLQFPGWIIAGGTSVSTPIIAGVYALAGNTATITHAWIYAHHKDLYDITSGSNGKCGGSYLCTAVKGYDGPTGWGTPHGIGAF